MRLRSALAVTGLFAASLVAHADTYLNYTIAGSYEVAVPDGFVLGGYDFPFLTGSFTGTAVFDQDTQLFSSVSFPIYRAYNPAEVSAGTFAYSTDPCNYYPDTDCFVIRPDNTFTYINTEYQDLDPGNGFGPEPYLQEYDGTLTLAPTAVTPEPSSFALLGTGMLGVAAMLKRRYA